jgi:hypothetical protein
VRTERLKKLLPALFCAALIFAACAPEAAAQCAMCKTSASNLEPGGVRNLNLAVLLLLVPPVAIFCGFFIAAYRRREPPGDDRRRD